MKINYKIFAVLIILLSITLTSYIKAQLTWTISTSQEYNDNPFRTQYPVSSFISSFDLGIEKSFDTSDNPMNIAYYGSYYNFSNLTDRNFYWHQLSLWKSYEKSGFGISAEQRYNGTLYTYYNYTNLSAFYRINARINDFYFTLSPVLNYTKYEQIPIMDNIKGSLNFSINHGFETGTTIILAGAFNYKKYIDPVQSGIYSYLDENDSLITENYTDRNIASLPQFNSEIQMPQSVTSTTGLAFQYTNKNIFSSIKSNVKELNLIYGDESEMFDDPIDSEGNNFSLELTQILFNDLEIKVGYFLNHKIYPSQGIYDKEYNYSASSTRIDDQYIFNLSLKKNFEIGNSSKEFSVGMNFQTIKNASNSFMFNYKSNSVYLYFGLNL